MKKPIEQQIAELTEEQKANLKPLYKKYGIILLSILGICAILGTIGYLYTSSLVNEAEEKYNDLCYATELNADLGIIDLDLMDEHHEAMDAYFDLLPFTYAPIGAAGLLLIIGVLVTYFVFKKKYPYFTEKRYTYLKKSGYYTA